MPTEDLIWTECAQCGVRFTQRDDPGTKRKYHSDACRQKAWRERHRAERRQYKFEQEQAWAKDQAKKQRERERSERRRTGREHVPEGVPAWCFPVAGDGAQEADERRLCFELYKRHLRPVGPDDHEAALAKVAADKKRKRWGF